MSAEPGNRSRQRRRGARFICALVALCVVAPTDLSANPVTTLTEGERDAFDREARLTPLVHQQALAIIDRAAADLAKLRKRLEPELANQPVPDRSVPTPAPPNASGCEVPAKRHMTLTSKQGFDNWFKAETFVLAGIRKTLVERQALWLMRREQDQHNVMDLHQRFATNPKEPQWAAAAMQDLVTGENLYYREQYQVAANALVSLWDAEQDELSGFQFSSDMLGLASLLDRQADGRMMDYYALLGSASCFQGYYIRAGNEPLAQSWAAKFSALHGQCVAERESLRDLYAKRFLDLRKTLSIEGADILQRLSGWRALVIASRFYVGNKSDVASLVYGDPPPKKLEQIDVWGAQFATGTVNYPPQTAEERGAPFDTAKIYADACGIEGPYSIKYLGVELAPYLFGIVFTPTAMASAAPAIHVDQGGRWPEEGP
jgi:hypothetical protein